MLSCFEVFQASTGCPLNIFGGERAYEFTKFQVANPSCLAFVVANEIVFAEHQCRDRCFRQRECLSFYFIPSLVNKGKKNCMSFLNTKALEECFQTGEGKMPGVKEIIDKHTWKDTCKIK